ncbi:hypothetical protein [Candidatus Williamhamiltonella defendens]|uniref:hypothetical protein n=1 Tax=Candidatus Williamhamiltonella defendens TaxID=138072 RepID=UPI001F2C443C|nr:hypothetical protein [Candidatus Hamiltonella defensa]
MLCVSAEHLQTLWHSLCDDSLSIPSAFCKNGEKALNVNNKAFSAYGLGVSQLISDNGHPITLSALKNENTLSSFMNGDPQKKKDE